MCNEWNKMNPQVSGKCIIRKSLIFKKYSFARSVIENILKKLAKRRKLKTPNGSIIQRLCSWSLLVVYPAGASWSRLKGLSKVGSLLLSLISESAA